VKLEKGYYWIQPNVKCIHSNLYDCQNITIGYYNSNYLNGGVKRVLPWKLIGDGDLFSIDEVIPLKRIPDYKE